jgi:putative mRNA 3-end processing factor
MADVLQVTEAGLYCPVGDFYIDPWKAVPRAVLTHGHADHARWGCGQYLVPAAGLPVFRTRLGADAILDGRGYGAVTTHNGVQISFHPAGHILGSAQVRVEHAGHVTVVSGDYKTAADATCAGFVPVRCQRFITESTFGLPIYHWPPAATVFAELNAWWRANAAAGVTSIIYAYALGKAQRLLLGLDATIGPLYMHGAVERLNAAYRSAGVPIPKTQLAGTGKKGTWAGGLVLAPPSAHGSTWARKFAPASTAIASGWMQMRGTRRRKAVDRGVVLSDHADWPGLLGAIRATRAERVSVTHGYTAVLSRWLREQGTEADVLATHFAGEIDDAPADDGA